MNAPVLAVLGLLTLATPALATAALAAPDYAGINRAVIDEAILPAYETFAERTATLDAATNAFCATPGQEGWDAMVAAEGPARLAWATIEQVRFGPVELLMRGFRVSFWPDKRGRVGKHLATLIQTADDGKLEPTSFGRGSVAVQGFPALERLIHGKLGGLSKYTEDPKAAFRCRLLRAVTGNLASVAIQLRDGWGGATGAYRETMLNPGADGPYDTAKAATGALFTAVAVQLEGIRTLKLDGPLKRNRLAEAWRSRRSLALIQANLDGLRPFLRAPSGGGLLAALDRNAGNALLADFQDLRARAEAVEGPIFEAVDDPTRRVAVETLAVAVLRFEEALVPALSRALDLPVGFNRLDGD